MVGNVGREAGDPIEVVGAAVAGEIEDEYDRRMEYYTKGSEAEFLVSWKMEVGRFSRSGRFA